MSRVRFRQSTSTYLPRYKKRTKKSQPLFTLQPENIPPLDLHDWNNDDFLNNSKISHILMRYIIREDCYNEHCLCYSIL